MARVIKGSDIQDPNDPAGTGAGNNTAFATGFLLSQADLGLTLQTPLTGMVGSGVQAVIFYNHYGYDLTTGVLTISLPSLWTGITVSTGSLS